MGSSRDGSQLYARKGGPRTPARHCRTGARVAEMVAGVTRLGGGELVRPEVAEVRRYDLIDREDLVIHPILVLQQLVDHKALDLRLHLRRRGGIGWRRCGTS